MVIDEVILHRTQQDIMRIWADNIPQVSVCCITYNHEDYIKEAINSFLMQVTNFSFEILIHDDASTDKTSKIILEYAKKYPDIIRPIIQVENQYSKGGLINPRYVFPRARGRYIALCEGDDYWTDCYKLQKQFDFLEDHPEYVITYSDCVAVDEDGIMDINFGGATRDVSQDELVKCIPLYTLTTFFRNLIKEVPLDLIPARIGDRVIWSLLGAYGKGKYLGEIKPAVYRVHGGGVFSQKSKMKKNEMTCITFNALFSYYTRLGAYEYAQYFKERSLVLLMRTIGIKRILTILIRAVAARLSNVFRR